jgi:hypothetical protein
MFQFNQDSGHVVAAETTAWAKIFGTALVHHTLNALDELLHGTLFALNLEIVVVRLFVNVADTLLGSHHVPNTITGQKNELSILSNLHALNIGESGDSLVFCLKISVVLVLKVSQSSWKSQHAVDSWFFDEAVCSHDSTVLLRIVRFVVDWQVHSLLSLAEDSTRITGVTAVDLVWCDESNSSGASRLQIASKFALASIAEHHFIDFHEGLLKRQSIVLGFVAWEPR